MSKLGAFLSAAASTFPQKPQVSPTPGLIPPSDWDAQSANKKKRNRARSKIVKASRRRNRRH